MGWSRNVLLNQIKAKAFERSITENKTNNFSQAMPAHMAELADEAMKSSYNLEFLGINEPILEAELEKRLILKLKDFILELGYGFCFIGNQYKITLEEKEYFIDILFYHRFLKCLVALELKVSAFTPEHAGKMDFYLNVLNAKEKAEDDNPSIGIILCAEKNNTEVEFSLQSKNNPIGVAEYKLYKELPEELKGKLPAPGLLVSKIKEEFGDR
jgi:predicted nuclease of restriction endonuclease-like (RecB) superfamily